MAKYIVNSIVCALSLGLFLASNHVQVRADISVAEEILSVPHGALSEISPLIPITNTHVPEAAMDLFQDYADKLHQAYGDLKDSVSMEDVAHTFLENLGPLSSKYGINLAELSPEIMPQALEDMAESLHRKYDISLDSAKQAILLIRKMQLLPSSLREYEVPHLNFIPALPPIAGINLEDYASKLQQAYEDHASKLYQVYEDLTNGVSKEEVAQALMDNIKELTPTHGMDLGELSPRMSQEPFEHVADSLHDRYDLSVNSAKQAIQLIRKFSMLPSVLQQHSVSSGLDEMFSGMKSRAHGFLRTGSPPPPPAPIYSPPAFDQIAAYASGLQQAYAGLKAGVPRAEVAHSLLGTLKEMASAHGTSLAALTANVMPLNLGNISESLHDKYDVGFDSAKQAIQHFRKLSPLPPVLPQSERLNEHISNVNAKAHGLFLLASSMAGSSTPLPESPASIHSIPKAPKFALGLLKDYASKLRLDSGNLTKSVTSPEVPVSGNLTKSVPSPEVPVSGGNLTESVPSPKVQASESGDNLKELESMASMDVAELSSKLVPGGLEDMTELLNGKVDVSLDSVAAIGDRFGVDLDSVAGVGDRFGVDLDSVAGVEDRFGVGLESVAAVGDGFGVDLHSVAAIGEKFGVDLEQAIHAINEIFGMQRAVSPSESPSALADTFIEKLSSQGMALTDLCAAIVPVSGEVGYKFGVSDSLASINDIFGVDLDSITIGDIFGVNIDSINQVIQKIRDFVLTFRICPSP